jgi:ribosome recycling factor
MLDEVYLETNEKMEKTIETLKEELGGVRAGRANPHILDRIRVDYYGTPTPINQIGNIMVPEPRLLVIAPWDPSMIPAIEKALQVSDIGIMPSNDGKVIRLTFPELTEERRKELVKLIHKMGEETKIAIRNERRQANDELKKEQKNNDLTEDDLRDGEQEVQKMTDEHTKTIDTLITDKEKEIMEV